LHFGNTPVSLRSLRVAASRLYAVAVGQAGGFGGSTRRAFSARLARHATTAVVQFTPGLGNKVILGPHRLAIHSSRRLRRGLIQALDAENTRMQR